MEVALYIAPSSSTASPTSTRPAIRTATSRSGSCTATSRPHNVMVAFGGDVKIIDFGIARSAVKRDVTQAGQAVGKVRYMAPEQARAESVTSAADIWAASILLTELFTGKRFWGDLRSRQSCCGWRRGCRPVRGVERAARRFAARVVRGLDLDPKKRPSAAALKATIWPPSDVQPSASATRSLMEALYAGEEQEEERARTALIQEPTAVRANALWSRTASEDTPPGELDVDTAAPTASRIAVDPDVAAQLFQDADDDVSSTDESAAPATARTRAPSSRRLKGLVT